MAFSFLFTDWRKALLVCAGAAVVAYALIILWYVPATPDIGIRCGFQSVIKHVDPRYLVPESHDEVLPEDGDTILEVGGAVIGQKPGSANRPQAFWAQVLLLRALNHLRDEDSPDGTRSGPDGQKEVKVKFWSERGQEEQSIWCRLGYLPSDQIIPSLLWFFLKLGLFTVGALVFWKRPTDHSAAQFFLLCIVTLGAYMGGYHWARIAGWPPLLLVFMVCGVLLPPISLHFYLIFPRAKDFVKRYPRQTWVAIYGLPVCFLVALIYSYFHLRWLRNTEPESSGAASDIFRLEIAVYLWLSALGYLASVVSLIHSYRTAADITERNQVKWILFGAVLALLPIGYTLYLVSAKPEEFGAGGATWYMFAASVCFTVAFAISITRYRLMQLDQIVSSGAIYFLISLLAGLVYYAIVFVGMLGAELVGTHTLPGTSLTQTAFVCTTVLVLMLLLDLGRSQFKKVLDRRFFREKHQLDRTLQRMGQAIEQLVDPPTLARRLLQACSELLHVSRGAVYIREGKPPLYRLVHSLGTSPQLLELSSGCPLIEALEKGRAVTAGPGMAVDPALRQLKLLGGEVAFALAHEGDMLAFLVLGPKDVGLYRQDDLNLLAAFAQLTALALDSATGHRTIEVLNHDLQAKVEKISEQQRRILALQSQITKGAGTRNSPADKPGLKENGRNNEKQPSNGGPSASVPLAWAGIIGSSLPMRQLLEMVRKVSASQSAVLIRGESGTGKELLARALHDSSPRSLKRYVKVHCAALSPGLLESELFGHVKGAFTDAHRDKIGRFELAHGGTIFLDEIGDISLDVQTKLLRVLDEKIFERVGSSESVEVDVRIITATHQNLEELIHQGRFREDLYFRLKVIDLTPPPLRERREDIPELALHFLKIYQEKCSKEITLIDDDAMATLKSYRWPGNIRELENVIERAVVMTDGGAITVADLPLEVVQAAHQRVPPDSESYGDESAKETLPLGGLRAEREEHGKRERERLVRALAAADGNKALAARALGLARSTLISRLKKYGLS